MDGGVWQFMGGAFACACMHKTSSPGVSLLRDFIESDVFFCFHCVSEQFECLGSRGYAVAFCKGFQRFVDIVRYRRLFSFLQWALYQVQQKCTPRQG
jgi:hypothetical protein